MTVENGDAVYRRDGHVYKAGLLFGELYEAVKGVPAAERAARTYQRRVRAGFLTLVGGMVCSAIAFNFVDDEPDGGLDRASKIALTTSLACTGVMLGGTILFVSSTPYHSDAINLFNDSVPLDGPVYLPGQPRSADRSAAVTKRSN